MTDRATRRQDLLASLFLVALVTAWFWRVLFGGQLFYTRDIYGYHYPMKKIVRDAMLSGELPVWSPYFGAGQPIAANPAWELFYPPQWLILLPDFHFGMTLHIVVHFYICALGLYFLLRSLGAGPPASVLGAMAFTLGGPMISLIRTLPLLFSMAWAPVMFLFARRYFLSGSRRDLLLTMLFGGMQALVAEPTTMLQTWLLIGFYMLYRLWHTPAAKRGAQFRSLAMGAALLVAGSLTVAAAQIVPMFDFIPDSVRSQALEYKTMVAAWSLATSRPLEMFYPQLFQSLSNVNGTAWIATLYTLGEPFVANFYIGAVIAIFFIAGLIAWQRGAGLVVGSFVFFYLVAIGEHTPLLRFLYDVGIFKSMRFPEKFGLACALVAVIWGALTADRLFRGEQRIRRAVLWVVLGWAVLALLLLATAYNVPAWHWLMTFARGAVIVAVVLAMRKRPHPAWPAALIALTALDLAHVRAINLTITRHYFTPPPITQKLSADKNQYRLFHAAEWDWKYAMPHADVYFMSSMGRWWSLRNSLMPRNGAYWGYRYGIDTDYDQTYLKPTADFVLVFRMLRDSGAAGWENTLMAMSNAWYRASFRDFASEAKRTGEQFEQMMPVDFVPAPQPYPRYYFADQLVPYAETIEFARSILNTAWSPRVAFVKGDVFVPQDGIVRTWSETWRTIRVEAESSGRSLLVMSVTPHKYWRARVDGNEVKPRVVNVGYQGIELAPGKHTVTMEYVNPLIVPSMILSIVALLAIAVAASVPGAGAARP